MTAPKVKRKGGPISLEILHVLICYNPETGSMVWKERSVDLFVATEGRSAQGIANTWNAKNAGKEALRSVCGHGYRAGSIFGISITAHRVAFAMANGFWPVAVDHINGDKTDNRAANLRAATTAENSRNYKKPPGKNSRYRGVSKSTNCASWTAAISCAKSKRKIHLGSFRSEATAAEAYDIAAREMHGDFATLNFPPFKAYEAMK